MKRLSRITLKVAAGLAALIVAGLLAGLTGVDQRPYLTCPYYTNTAARLQILATNQNVVFGPLEAGFGKVSLTPTINAPTDNPLKGEFRAVPLAGYGARRGAPAKGVHDELWVKATALRVAGRTGVIVSADALIIPPEVAAEAAGRLREELQLARAQVYFGATHTHASLGGWGQGLVAEAFAGGFQPGVRTWFAGQLVAAVRAALSDLKPAALGTAGFAAPALIRNRLVGNRGKVDNEFSFLFVKQTEGRAGVLGVYGAHATVLSDQVMEFSGDYPGAWTRALEQATGGFAMFLAGGVGSHSPVAGARGFDGIERMGRALAEEVRRRLPDLPLTNRVAFAVLGLEVDMPEVHARVSDGWRLRPWLAKRLLPVAGRTLLQAFRVNNSVWFSTPCDFSGELALGIKDNLSARGLRAVVTSFNGDYIGYVIPDKYYHLGGYEPRTMSFFGPNTADYLDELLRALAAAASPGI